MLITQKIHKKNEIQGITYYPVPLVTYFNIKWLLKVFKRKIYLYFTYLDKLQNKNYRYM